MTRDAFGVTRGIRERFRNDVVRGDLHAVGQLTKLGHVHLHRHGRAARRARSAGPRPPRDRIAGWIQDAYAAYVAALDREEAAARLLASRLAILDGAAAV